MRKLFFASFMPFISSFIQRVLVDFLDGCGGEDTPPADPAEWARPIWGAGRYGNSRRAVNYQQGRPHPRRGKGQWMPEIHRIRSKSLQRSTNPGTKLNRWREFPPGVF